MGRTIRDLAPDLCTGCGACFNQCAVNAITMSADAEGFLCPVIDDARCIQCGACERVCPALHPPMFGPETPDCYAVMAKDEVRWVTSSGGMFVLAADWILEHNGFVCGAEFTEDFRGVRHAVIDHWTKLPQLMRSKYVQSDTNTVYRQIKTLLNTTDKPVLFCGCPCQVAALRNYIGEHDRLYLLDLLCHSIGSPKAYRAYLDQLTDGGEKPIKDFAFKTKDEGWGAWIKVEYADGAIYHEDMRGDFYRAYLQDLNTRKSCTRCLFARAARVGDISIGDFWGVEKINPAWNDKKGTSLILVNTKKGVELLEYTRNKAILCEKASFQIAKVHNRPLAYPTPLRDARSRFFSYLDKRGFHNALLHALKERFDVGIVGWWGGVNYGSSLTSYALYTFLLSQNKTAAMIRPPVKDKANPASASDFAKRRFHISKIRYDYEMTDLNNPIDAFIVGSDQLWFYPSMIQNGYLFMLNFVKDSKKKIAYSTSFGHDKSYFPDSALPLARAYMNRFDYVSTRETSGVDICREVFGKEAVQIPDPVFLCEAEVYEKLAADARIKTQGNFIFAYILDPDEEKKTLLRITSQRLGKQVVAFTDMQGDYKPRLEALKDFNAIGGEVEDWLWHIIHCDFSIVDSFHGMCLSIIFNKPFIVINNARRGSTRLQSFLAQTEFENRLLNSPNEIFSRYDLFQTLDFSGAENFLKRERERGRKWLLDALDAPLKRSATSLADLARQDAYDAYSRIAAVEQKIAELSREASAAKNKQSSISPLYDLIASLAPLGGHAFDYFADKGYTEIALYSGGGLARYLWEQGYHANVLTPVLLGDKTVTVQLRYPRTGEVTFQDIGTITEKQNLPLLIDGQITDALRRKFPLFTETASLQESLSFSYAKRGVFERMKELALKYPRTHFVVLLVPALWQVANRSDFENAILQGKADRDTIYKTVFVPQSLPRAYYDESTKPAKTEYKNGYMVMSDAQSKYFNSINGCRVTTDLPERSNGNVYVFGNSVAYGVGCSDEHTIESFLQGALNRITRWLQVVNCGNGGAMNVVECRRRMDDTPFADGDTAVLLLSGQSNKIPEIMGKTFPICDARKLFDRPHYYGEIWLDTDHFNFVGNRLAANTLAETLEQAGALKQDGEYSAAYKNLVTQTAQAKEVRRDALLSAENEEKLVEYVSKIKQIGGERGGVKGSIVMNCNPFTLGHLYLIEYAASRVDALYIFVVEEDRSIFPFTDRFELVKAGTAHLPNVVVVPSGQFIISKTTFQMYFLKETQQNAAIDASMDVEIFGQKIAPALEITVRFAGEEPLDNITRQYNATMRFILPKYGVRFEVIPRKESGDAPISASRVRAFLKEGNFEEIAKLVPKTTLEYLKEKSGGGVRLKNILVFGGTRQMGPYLVKELLNRNYSVAIANRGRSNNPFANEVERLILDKDDPVAVMEKLGGREFDAVFDTIAYNAAHVERLLSAVKTDYYIQFSSNAVYRGLKNDIRETDFNPADFNPADARFTTGDFSYQMGKRAVEKASLGFAVKNLRIRIPYVGGVDDFSKRLVWFVENIRKGAPMQMSRFYYDRRFAMAHTSEAGKFAVYAYEHGLTGAYNIASEGTVSVRALVEYIEKRLDKKANIIWGDENKCHYNNVPENSMNTDKAKSAGYRFMRIDDWLWETLDFFCTPPPA